MQIRIGYELIYDCPQSTPMILTLNVHFTRVSDIIVPDHLVADPPVLITAYRDGFGNWCSRIVAPKGQVRLSANAVVKDTGKPDVVAAWFEAYLDGHWYTFDARNNTPRIGRVLIARGRDATDVPISNTFGPNTLKSFKVWTEEVGAPGL